MGMQKANHRGSAKLLVVGAIALVGVAVATFIACRKPVISDDPESKPTTTTKRPLSEADIALCNQGVAEMGKFKYASAMEQFQTELNEVKVVDLSTLSTAVTKSIRGMREAIEQILGDAKDEVTKEPEDDVFGRP